MKFLFFILGIIVGGILGCLFDNNRYTVMNERQVLDVKKGVIYRYYDSKIIMIDMVEGKRVEYEVKRYKK